jgi:hypothetical protein
VDDDGADKHVRQFTSQQAGKLEIVLAAGIEGCKRERGNLVGVVNGYGKRLG